MVFVTKELEARQLRAFSLPIKSPDTIDCIGGTNNSIHKIPILLARFWQLHRDTAHDLQ
jgi:hypothetical protein